MSRFPLEEHRRYVERVARQVLTTWARLQYVHTIPTSGVDERAYKVVVCLSDDDEKHETLRVTMQMVERCIHDGSDREMREHLNALLAMCFPIRN